MFSLEDKTAVITGGAGHLCSEMARGLAKMGCNIAILDNNLDRSTEVAYEVKEIGVNAVAYQLDARRKADFASCAERIKSNFRSIDILINGAGINAPTPFMEITEAEFDDIIAVQLKGTMFGCQVFGRLMLDRGKGSIINISSASAGPPLSKAFTYSVAKAGIKNLTQNLAREWATQGVRVNAIRPGFFPTKWSQERFITPEREEAILRHTPMGRYGQPAELAGAIIWLASDASSFVTGAEITIDGGFSAMTI